MFSLKVITPLGEYLNEEVQSVQLTTAVGQMVLLSNHMPIVAALVPCPLNITTAQGTKQEFALAGGFLHFSDNKALILTDAAEGSHSIDLERAQKAYQRAKARLEKRDSTTNMKRAELALNRALNRINVAGKN